VHDRDRAREVGGEDGGGLQRRDEDRLQTVVVLGDLSAELLDPRPNLLGREVDLPDSRIG